MKRWISAAAVLALLGGSGLAQDGTTTTASGTAGGAAMPELPVAEWNKNGPVSLEDFRGQLTAVVFYDDNES